MKFINLPDYLRAALILAFLVMMWGCGSNGESTPNVIVSKGATVSVIPSGNGEYVIQGDRMDGVAGMNLNLSYDLSKVSSPVVTQGEATAGAFFTANTNVPGSIKIAIFGVKSFSSNGQIAKISFSNQIGTTSITIDSVEMFDSNATPIP